MTQRKRVKKTGVMFAYFKADTNLEFLTGCLTFECRNFANISA